MMTLIAPDKIDATLAAEYCTGIGATTGPPPMNALEWMHYAKALEADNKALKKEAWRLQEKLAWADDDYKKLNTEAETRAAQLESQITHWKLATYAVAVVFLVTIGGLVMGMAG